MNNYTNRCTNIFDRRGNLLFENDRCRSWHQDDTHPEGGFWLYEQIKHFKNDWYLFEIDHEYDMIDDFPVLLKKYLNDIEKIT